MVKKILCFILAFILITVGGFYIYTLDFYRATPDVDTLMSLMGHSLGGAMASSHLEKHAESYENLILLAAYPVSDAPVPSLAIYGTYDRVLDLTKVVGATEIVPIEGGNHAYFGNYGEQEGDGAATLTRLEQQEKTVERITEFILKP